MRRLLVAALIVIGFASLALATGVAPPTGIVGTAPITWGVLYTTPVPVASAQDAGTLISVPIQVNYSTPGGCFAWAQMELSAGTIADNGWVCLQEGFQKSGLTDAGPPLFIDAGCQKLDGGASPMQWDIGSIHAPQLQFAWTPGASADGGSLYIIANTTR